MAASLSGIFSEDLEEKINSCKLLVVGAGGIGCELLKDLVLTGFNDLDIIDLDTIDVSNLNRQFLFQKKHVGKSKSKVAQESAQVLNPNAKIRAHHDSVMSPDYGMDYFKQFTIVLNALDNRAARNHVNRMCLAADVPLIESGTAGYLGQVTVIKKGLTECYECQPKAAQKTYPGCTIRNTPSEPIHCIVWAKHLFNQLFGEADADEDVSPDTADPEAGGDAGEDAMQTDANSEGNVERLSTRAWAVSTGYNPEAIFNKLFHDDIKYLLSMDKLWQKRRPPTPLVLGDLPDVSAGSSKDSSQFGIKDQRVWTIKEAADILSNCIKQLGQKLQALKEGDILVWDKDDDLGMDFVTACANIRAHIFGIALKSRFDVKSMAGNIIPAIATTNAIIAGLIVMQALQILDGRINDCRTIYLKTRPNPKNKLLVPCVLDKPNPKCYVCSNKPEVSLRVNVTTFTMKMLEDKVLKSNLNMVAPDVEIDGKGIIVISSEEGETEENNDKTLEAMNIRHGTRLKCDDFLQNYELVVNIIHCEKMEENVEFEVVGDVSQLQAKPEEENKPGVSNGAAGEPVAQSSKVVDDDDDLVLLEEEGANNVTPSPAKKRKATTDEQASTSKKLKTTLTEDDDDEIVLL